MSGEAIKPGYKRTEVGVIPEDWEVRQLSEHFQIYAGGDVPKSSLSQFRSESHPHPIFANALQNNGLYGFTAERRAKADSVTVTARGYLGHAEYRAEEFFPIVRLLVLEPIGSLDAEFTAFAINERVKFAFESTGVPQLTAPQVGKYSVAAPPVPEQRAIAGALSDVDNLLAKLDQLIAKKRDLKQATMQQLLTGQTRLPGFSGEWMVKRLGNVGNCLRGVTYKGDSDLQSHDTAQTKRLLRSNNVQNSTIVIEDIQFVDCNRVAEHQLLRRNDILICMANGSKALVGKAGFFDIADGYDYTFGAFMGCFRVDASVSDPTFVFYLFQTARYRDYINNLLAGSSINNLTQRSIDSLEFRMPQMVEQTAIATALSDMDAEIACLEARLDKTRNLKQGMMQELLSGRIRVVGVAE